MFFSLFQMSARITLRPRTTKKTCVFFLASTRIRVLPISEKTVNFGIEKNYSEKKQVYFERYKKKFQLCFFCFFFVALINFFENRSKVFLISSLSLTFPEICPMFFYFVTLNNFFNNRFNVFFLKCFFSALSH